MAILEDSKLNRLLFLLFLLIQLFGNVPTSSSSGLDIRVSYTGYDDISLEDLSSGSIGKGILKFYYPFEPERILISVLLIKEEESGDAVAKVYQNIPRSHWERRQEKDEFLWLIDSLYIPVVEIIAPDGWWVRDGVTNYNLDITVYGDVVAMWGAASGQADWAKQLKSGEPNARIIVRDTNHDGIPDWDWRTMLPHMPNRILYRTNYSERKCETPLEIDQSFTPDWPYIAKSGSFEQQAGKFTPPIVIDWEAGRVRYFSELVTVRNQNCSYSFYSIKHFDVDSSNTPNFESPFAFYDLSGEGTGYPNLILRTERYLEDDNSFFFKDNPETQSIRYSWRNAVGDREWDYKIDLLGNHRYSSRTSIANRYLLVDAPPYETFPDWVINHGWPAISFIAREAGQYRSSEGIYEWSTLGLSRSYFFGLDSDPHLELFQDIRSGLRGEYRLGSNQKPETYFSPIDNRLHLSWAKLGLWRLDENQIVRLANIDNDMTIDLWSRETKPILSIENPRIEMLSDDRQNTSILTESTAFEPAESEVVEALYALDGLLIHTTENNLQIVQSDYDPILFKTLPPTDHESWLAHRALLDPYKEQRRDPADLSSWLDAFPGPRSRIIGATLTNMRTTQTGFRFELDLQPGFRIQGTDLLAVAGLSPGSYSVQYDDHFYIDVATSSEIAIDSILPGKIDAVAINPTPFRLQVSNLGGQTVVGLNVFFSNNIGNEPIKVNEIPITVYGNESIILFYYLNQAASSDDFSFWITDAGGQVLDIEQLSLKENVNILKSPLELVGISTVPQLISTLILLLGLFLLLLRGVTIHQNN